MNGSGMPRSSSGTRKRARSDAMVDVAVQREVEATGVAAGR